MNRLAILPLRPVPVELMPRGGKRPGAGRKLKDPKAGNRVTISARLAPHTLRTLDAMRQRGAFKTRSEGIDEAVSLAWGRAP